MSSRCGSFVNPGIVDNGFGLCSEIVGLREIGTSGVDRFVGSFNWFNVADNGPGPGCVYYPGQLSVLSS